MTRGMKGQRSGTVGVFVTQREMQVGGISSHSGMKHALKTLFNIVEVFFFFFLL